MGSRGGDVLGGSSVAKAVARRGIVSDAKAIARVMRGVRAREVCRAIRGRRAQADRPSGLAGIEGVQLSLDDLRLPGAVAERLAHGSLEPLLHEAIEVLP